MGGCQAGCGQGRGHPADLPPACPGLGVGHTASPTPDQRPQGFCLWDGRRNQVAPGSPSPRYGVSMPAWPGCGPGLLQQHGGHIPSWTAQPARCQALRHWLSQGQGPISAFSAQAGHRSVWPLWPGNAVPPLPWAPNPRGRAPKTLSHLLLDLVGTAQGSASSLGWGWGVRIQGT